MFFIPVTKRRETFARDKTERQLGKENVRVGGSTRHVRTRVTRAAFKFRTFTLVRVSSET